MFMKHAVFVCAAAAALTLVATTAQAGIIFSQTPNFAAGFASDRSASQQLADNLTLAATATARSVTWRGVFYPTNTPLAPVTFDLIFYGDNGSNLPDLTNVLSTTTVNFASTDLHITGTVPTGLIVYDEYEFQANINPTLLTGGTQAWFSVLADTSNDVDDTFYWMTGYSQELAAYRDNLSPGSPFLPAIAASPFYFVLDDAVNPSAVSPVSDAVPEPASLALSMLGLGGLALVVGRRQRCAVKTG